MARAGAARGDAKPADGELGSDEPLADWERELLARGDAPAAAPAADAPSADAPAAEAPTADESEAATAAAPAETPAASV
jgi:small subunit ribosomal protein S2